MPLNVLAGVGAFVAILGVVILARFGIAYARSDDLSVSWDRTTRWTMMLATGVAGAVTVGLIQFGDLVGMAVEFVVSHPYFVTNIGITSLGAGALSGLFTLSTGQFVGIAMMLVGLVFLVVEVDQYVG
ncbi:hypothetical protein [Haloarcula pellucida]|uniref:Uncharacterized protein n=1 Tax=Haloarcula pellucida TaxID=1427151 RepID=A0A830GKD3_9EURY|nr:hypothetical protein [Halomicroarcula pellucida]MBX0348678.1 hypothetical protein [Halomicroarcula pellucida]GGN92261.1 hypothetical protein GCM10009030_16310 [Halomicroarcula pellucida]